MNTIKRNTDAQTDVSNEVGLEVRSQKFKHMRYIEFSTRRNRDIKIVNIFFELCKVKIFWNESNKYRHMKKSGTN